MAYIAFDVHSFVKRLIRVPGARQNRHSRKGNRSGRPGPRRRGPGGIPEIADMAADVIDPDGDMKPPRYRTPTQFLFVVDDVVERFGYTLMLFESVGSLAWEPFAAILQSDKRLCPSIGRIFSTADRGPITPLFDWLATAMTSNEVNIGYSQSYGYVTTPLHGTHVFVFAGSFINGGDEDSAFGARIKVNGEPRDTMIVNVSAKSEMDFIVSCEVEAGSAVQWDCRVYSASNAEIGAKTFFGYQVSD